MITKDRLKKWSLNLLAVLIGLGMASVFLLGLEFFAQYQLKRAGQPFRTFASYKTAVAGRLGLSMSLDSMDPLLGHQWDITVAPPNLVKNHLPFIVADRFKIYLSKSVRDKWEEHSRMVDIRLTPEVLAKLERPFIIALGGSTTDPFGEYHIDGREGSWPEELARLLEDNNKPGTIFNGGVLGYVTAQELLKLLRDTLEMEPNVVISYDGFNDFSYYTADYQYVRDHQVNVYKKMLGMLEEPSGIFPNLRAYSKFLLKKRGKNNDGREKLYLGRKPTQTAEERLARNWKLMHAICEASGIRYYGVLQPVFGIVKPADDEHVGDQWNFADNPKKIEAFRLMRSGYEKICETVESREYLADFTMIFADEDDKSIYIFDHDPAHVSLKGNRIIAENMYRLLTNGGLWLP